MEWTNDGLNGLLSRQKPEKWTPHTFLYGLLWWKIKKNISAAKTNELGYHISIIWLASTKVDIFCRSIIRARCPGSMICLRFTKCCAYRKKDDWRFLFLFLIKCRDGSFVSSHHTSDSVICVIFAGGEYIYLGLYKATAIPVLLALIRCSNDIWNCHASHCVLLRSYSWDEMNVTLET